MVRTDASNARTAYSTSGFAKSALRPELPRCRWCGKPRRNWSNWEQQHLRSDEWSRLCSPCARHRLGNPWNALLPMRRIGEAINRRAE